MMGCARPASAASVLNASGFPACSARSLSRSLDLRSRSPYRRSPSPVPCKSRRSGSRRLYAGHRLARSRAPARLIPRANETLGFDAICPFRRLNDDARADLGPSALERLPDPHLPGSSPAFSLDAHHDGLQPTQHQGGLAPTPQADAGGPAILHLSHSTAYQRTLLHRPSLSVRDAHLQDFAASCSDPPNAPGRTRTCDPRLRRPSLYPAELRGPVLLQTVGTRSHASSQERVLWSYRGRWRTMS